MPNPLQQTIYFFYQFFFYCVVMIIFPTHGLIMSKLCRVILLHDYQIFGRKNILFLNNKNNNNIKFKRNNEGSKYHEHTHEMEYDKDEFYLLKRQHTNTCEKIDRYRNMYHQQI